MTDDIKLNDGHIHEAIDRINVALDYLHNTLAEHALIETVPEFECEVKKSMEILSDLYQKIASFENIYEIEGKYKI